jgi:Tol biopolymer transport system component
MRFAVRRFIVATSLTLALVLATTGSALATPPGVNGRITFMQFDENGRFQIFVANPDLSQQTQITPGTSDGWFPSWSPDGSRIVFASHSSDPDPDDAVEIMDVFTMSPDGSDVRKVTDSVGYSGTPSWSPDGRWIVYSADRADYPRGQGIYIVPSDGSAAPRRITTLPAASLWHELARFSPDGTRLVFTEYRGGHVLRNHRDGALVGEQSALFTVRPDGSDLHQITPWGIHASDADWSPDGTRLVFGAQPTHIGNIGDVMIADADGGHLKDLTQDHGFTGPGNDTAVRYAESFNPAWSPDGTKIIFVAFSYTAEDGFVAGLQTMDPDGSERAFVGSEPVEGHQPDWGTAPPLP